jgi:hypothetical protein
MRDYKKPGEKAKVKRLPSRQKVKGKSRTAFRMGVVYPLAAKTGISIDSLT